MAVWLVKLVGVEAILPPWTVSERQVTATGFHTFLGVKARQSESVPSANPAKGWRAPPSVFLYPVRLPQLYLVHSLSYSSRDITVSFARPNRAVPAWNKLSFAPCWRTGASPSPGPFCDHPAVSVCWVCSENWLRSSSWRLSHCFLLRRSRENRGEAEGDGSRGGAAASCHPCFRLVRGSCDFLSSPTEDAPEPPVG